MTSEKKSTPPCGNRNGAGDNQKGNPMSELSVAPQLPERLLDVDALAALLGGGRRLVYRMREDGQLPPAIKLGQRLRWRESAIISWLAEQEEVA